MTLGKRIATRMKELGLTQIKIARRSGLTQQAISNIINEKCKPSYDAIASLSQALSVTPAWFFGEDPSGAPIPENPSADNSTLAPDLTAPRNARGRPRKTTFVIGHYMPMQHLGSPLLGLPVVCKFYELMFNSLIESRDGQLKGTLAVDWKNAGNSMLFQIRDGARFHNRRPVTTEDVRWSYEQHLRAHPDDRRIDGVEVIDGSIVALHLKSPCGIENLPGVPIFPSGTNAEELIGTGPFQAVELKPGFWRVRRNPHYFLSKPFFDEVQVREYPNPPALEKAILAGEVHFALGVYVDGEDYVAHAENAIQRYHLHFMFNQPLMQNRALRKAIDLALDRQELTKAAGLKHPRYSIGPFDYILGDFAKRPQPTDVATAKQLLKLVPELENEVLRVNCYVAFPQTQPLTEAVVSQLNRFGIRAEIGENPHIILATRNVSEFQFEAPTWETNSPANFSHYSNPEVDRLIKAYQNEPIPPEQLRELRELIQQDLPEVPLFYNERPFTYVKRLRALEDKEPSILRLNEIHTWYLDSENGTD
jgi:ABC-type transport system substrate-binding protein